jgi:histidine ammonia-lyase
VLIAARRAEEIYNNTAYIIAFELMCGAQGAEIRGKDLLSTATSILFNNVRRKVPYLSSDHCLTDYLEDLANSIKNNEIVQGLEEMISAFF